MTNLAIKCFILLIILSLVSVAVGEPENNAAIDTSIGNTTIIDNTTNNSSTNNATTEISQKNNATNNISISNATNAIFHIINTTSGSVSNAIVIVVDSAGNKAANISNADGKATVHVSQGKANITVNADGYEELISPTMISENATITYVLISSMDKTKWSWIAFLIPFWIVLLFYLFLLHKSSKKYHRWIATLPLILWVFSFSLLFFIKDVNYNVFFLDPKLKVPFFVPIAALLGAASYITVSLLENIDRKPLTSEWNLIYIAYGRRLLMAPYIAIIALFAIGVGDINNKGAVLFFAFFVGLYTKNIEGMLKELGMKLLSSTQTTDLNQRDFKALELVKRLGISANVYDKLFKIDIKNISDLVAIKPEKITIEGLNPEYLTGLRNKAMAQEKGKEELKENLGLDDELIDQLVNAGYYSIKKLSHIHNKCINEIAANIGISKDCFEGIVQNAKYEINNLYLFSWENISDNDYEKLREVLNNTFGIDRAKITEIKKIDDGKTITVSTDKQTISIKFIDEQTELDLVIDGDRTYKLIPRKENGKLNIYFHFN